MERKRRRRSGKKEEEKEGEREQEEKEYFEQEEAERRERARMREAVQKNGTGGGGDKFAPDAEEDPMPPLLPARFSLSTGTVLINFTNVVRSLAVANSHLAARVCQNSKHIPIG